MEIFFRLTMLLVGFLLVFLGFVVTLHSSHYVVSILLLFGGVMTMFGGVPNNE